VRELFLKGVYVYSINSKDTYTQNGKGPEENLEPYIVRPYCIATRKKKLYCIAYV
jgi:hypothetical protein